MVQEAVGRRGEGKRLKDPFHQAGGRRKEQGREKNLLIVRLDCRSSCIRGLVMRYVTLLPCSSV